MYKRQEDDTYYLIVGSKDLNNVGQVVLCSSTVSYTHLDVYKRPAMYRTRYRNNRQLQSVVLIVMAKQQLLMSNYDLAARCV